VIDRLDHVIVGVRDLDAAHGRYAALLGREASWRGEHPGAGSVNALFPLANTSLELLAPAGAGPVGDWLRAELDADGEGVRGLAFGTCDLEAVLARLRASGLEVGEPRPGMGRDPETGRERHWRHAFLAPGSARGRLVFAIERVASDEPLRPRAPAGDPAAAVEALDHVVVESPALDASRTLYGAGLGLRLALDRTFEARGLRMLFFRVGGVTVEVVGRAGAPDDRTAPDRFGGLAWRVPDADAARARLLRSGFDASPVREGHKPGTRVFTLRDGTCGVPTLCIEPSG
jgi:catechol 2,3-dioxygenase-like lactoylglutathione lyase family enzyme